MKNKSNNNSQTEAMPYDAMLATGVFLRLGKKQKEVINMMVIEDYYITEIYDCRDNTTTIELVDDAHNIDRDISPTLLESLKKRGVLNEQEITMCHEFPTKKYTFKEELARAAMDACC